MNSTYLHSGPLLTQLELYQFASLEHFIGGFSLLERRTMQLTHPICVLLEGVDISPHVVTRVTEAMKEHRRLLASLDVQLGCSWETLVEEMKDESRWVLEAFLRVVEDGGLLVRDVEGWPSSLVKLKAPFE